MFHNTTYLLFYRITIMMAIIVGTFALCWMPFAVMFILMPTSPTAATFFFETEEGLNAIEWITWIGKLY